MTRESCSTNDDDDLSRARFKCIRGGKLGFWPAQIDLSQCAIMARLPQFMCAVHLMT